MKLMDAVNNIIKRKAGRPFGSVTKNRSEPIKKNIQKPVNVFVVGDSVLVNIDNDPWHGFRVMITEVHDTWATCSYAGKRRAYNFTALSHFRDGFQKDFNYNK